MTPDELEAVVDAVIDRLIERLEAGVTLRLAETERAIAAPADPLRERFLAATTQFREREQEVR